MINIAPKRLLSRTKHPQSEDSIAHFTVNTDIDDIFYLSRSGVLSSSTASWILNDVTEQKDSSWFHTHFICETGNIACLSYAGSIVSVTPDNPLASLEGSFDDGIGAAAWCPDDTCIVILVKNNSLICLTNTWDVVNEVSIGESDLSTAAISWRGDGSHFITFTIPATESNPIVNIYNKDLLLLHTCRTVAEGPAAVVRNLLPAIAFNMNGSTIAVPQRTPKKLQVSSILFCRIFPLLCTNCF